MTEGAASYTESAARTKCSITQIKQSDTEQPIPWFKYFKTDNGFGFTQEASLITAIDVLNYGIDR